MAEEIKEITIEMPERRRLRYVTVYEQLYQMIVNNEFEKDHPLPSEPALAQMLGVSRMTLRQALDLLRDDGLLKKVQGKGNYITLDGPKRSSGLELLGNPVHKCIHVELDIQDVELDLRLELPTEYMQEHFERKTSVAVVVDRWYRSGGEFVAYSLGFIPIETISHLQIDLNQKEQLLELLEYKIYEIATRANLQIKSSESGDFISNKYVISPKKELNLILETIYGDDEYPLLFNKHYLLTDASTIQVYATKTPF